MLISRTDLARKTREMVDRAQRGETIVVESYGEEQIVLLDVVDYHILRGAAQHASDQPINIDTSNKWDSVESAIRAYLSESISLSKAAELLDMSHWELLDRFERLGIPIHLGPRTIEEARAEVETARRYSGK